MSQPHSHCRPLSTGKSASPTSTNIGSFISVWTLYKMMPYVSSFVSNFIDSKLRLGCTHDVVYCSTLFFFITVEYALNDHMAMYWSILLTVYIWVISSSWLLQIWYYNLPWQCLWMQICVTYFPCLTLVFYFYFLNQMVSFDKLIS